MYYIFYSAIETLNSECIQSKWLETVMNENKN